MKKLAILLTVILSFQFSHADTLSDRLLRYRIVETAYYFIYRIPYVFGGDSLSGMDCSSFVQYVYALNGIYLPRTAEEQAQMGTYVTDRLKPGDLIFFKDTYKPGISHVGIYAGKGYMIEDSSVYGQVVMVPILDMHYLVRHFAFAKRIIP